MLKKNAKHALYLLGASISALFICLIIFFILKELGCVTSYVQYDSDDGEQTIQIPQNIIATSTLDVNLYDTYMKRLANYPKLLSDTVLSSAKATSTPSIPVLKKKQLWPTDTAYPEAGALLPFDRIVAYYGNFYSGALGVLGAYPTDEMITHLLSEVQKWQAADPETKVIPALDYIAVTAQGSPGSDGLYRARMPTSEIQKAIDIANQIDGIVILDIQVGKSTLQKELPPLESFLKLPNVELAIDPEFSMKDGHAPGRVIGTFDAADVNYAANFLAEIVKKNHIPPKVLIVHRFTERMVTNYSHITPLPQVQILVDMDGYGTPAQKTKVYDQVVTDEPVQFTGIKLFYKNDVKYGGRMMTPDEVMKLQPRPSFVQYQ